MARVSDVYQSRFLKAVDLLNEETGEYMRPQVTIQDVVVEELPGRNNQTQTQPVLYFEGKKKCLPLNKTNATILQEQLGDEMDDWKGRAIRLYVTSTTFEGAQKMTIRIEPKGKPRAAAPAAAAPAVPSRTAAAPAAATSRDDFSDDSGEERPAAPARRAATATAERPTEAKPFDPDEIPF